MNFLKELSDKTLLICSNDIKKIILKELNTKNKLFDIKFMTMEELISKLYFSYDQKAIYYLMDKYKLKCDIALMYLQNIIYVENKNYKSDKLNKLVMIKRELEEQNLLIIDLLFKNYLKTFNVVVYGYDYLNNFFKKSLNMIKSITNIKIIDKQVNNYIPSVYEFATMEEEIEYVAFKISELLEKGIDINKIKITNIKEDYNNTLKKIFKFYKIPINLNETTAIINTELGKFFIDNLDSDVNKQINSLKENFNNDEIINQIINICNKYIDFSNNDVVKELITYDLKNTFVKKEKYKNAVDIVNINTLFDDEYVFCINFNEGIIPDFLKDEEYITNNLKIELGLEKIYEINNNIKKSIINNIHSIKNLIITYKVADNKTTYYPSILIKELHLNVLFTNKEKIAYSQAYEKVKLAKKLDLFFKYGNKDDNLNILYNTFNDNLYCTYDNIFDGVEKKLIYDYIDSKIYLSYSSMNDYNECSFKYYLKNIVNLNIYEETFLIFIGNLFHHILEVCLLTDLDVNDEVRKYTKNKVLTNKEQFFIDNLKEELNFIVNTIKNQAEEILLNKYLLEQEIIVTKGNNLKVTFKGIIDKIIYNEDINKVAVLVDYKTGITDIDLNYVPYGLKMQLPIYLYLVKQKFSDVSVAGFYLQKVLFDKEIITEKGISNKWADGLKLFGYSNSDIIDKFDKNYDNSKLIKSLKMTKEKEFYKNAKVMNNEAMNKLVNSVEKQIEECIKKIENVDFSINPKKIGYGNNSFKSCSYCHFKDICFKKEKDYINLPEIRGDDND